MKRAKRLLIGFLACCLLVTLFAPTVSAYANGTVNGIRFETTGTTLTFSGTGKLFGAWEYRETLWDCYGIETMIFEEGITELHDYIVDMGNFLKQIYLPVSMVLIDEDAFAVADNLTDVYYAGAPGQWEDAGFGLLFPDSVQIHFAKEDAYTWNQVEGRWYCYRNGVMQFGWVKWNYNWYYLDTTGAMQTGWQQVNGNWYYLKHSGEMLTGWQDIGNHRFYLGTNGVMVNQNTYIDGAWYRFDENGHYLGQGYGWSVKDGKTYYIQANGTEAKGWQKIENKWYFFESNGVMVTNAWRKDYKDWCYLTADGSMLVNGWAKDSKGWCYVGSEGYCLRNVWQKDSKGWCYLGSDCRMVVSDWVQYKNYWYYLDADGYMVTGRMLINGKLYIFDDGGKMFADTLVNEANGRSYYASANGTLLTGWHCLKGGWYYFYTDGHMAKETYIDNHYLNEKGMNTLTVEISTLLNYEYGASKEDAAKADAVMREIAQDALQNGGDTDYSKVDYAMERLHKLYSQNYNSNIPLGVEYSVAGPVLYQTSGNNSDAMAMSKILTYMGYDNIRDRAYVYLKMDGEYGYVFPFNRTVAYGSPADRGKYTPLNITNVPTVVNGTWVQNQGKWYFKTTQGKYHVGWLRWKDNWYYMNSDGSMKTGWLSYNNKWYFLRPDGKMATGWLSDNSKWYYMQEDGAMTTGKFFAKGQYYFADSKGVMITGWVKENGKWYYAESNGVMAYGCKKTINGVTYCFNEAGQMYVGWFQDYFGNWYYAESNGVLVKGWKQISGTYYYFYNDYHMAANTYIDNHYVDENGKWVSSVSVNRDPQHYKNLTADQAAAADAIAKAIADEAMANGGDTDGQKIYYAAQLVDQYVKQCTYSNDEDKFYRSPYGVFVANVYTCAGATRAMGRVLEFMGYKWYHPGENQWDHQWVVVKMDGEYGWIDVQKSGVYMGFGNLLDNYSAY